MASTLPSYGAASSRHSDTSTASPWRQRAMGWLLLLVLLGLLVTSRHLKAGNSPESRSAFSLGWGK
ncbi:hypothetical protein [Hymenobacter chitinivorans]|uniref:Uncharacterized protein n=1 Tax=Hymenobacter chitinivorans DSM 11115 TaxID=1121954 RepID=A0A2M9BQX5_9BACT|nr:hypothetical protein [Hymenobacter chitinivorans]PJJ60349.1 hypothetical protein CLV45_1774 [Hymenobacter chitinivorans DSM 11115]